MTERTGIFRSGGIGTNLDELARTNYLPRVLERATDKEIKQAEAWLELQQIRIEKEVAKRGLNKKGLPNATSS